MLVEGYYKLERAVLQKDLSELEKGNTLVVQKDNIVYAATTPNPPARFIAYLEFPAGEVRGNEYHLTKNEKLIVLTGRLMVMLHSHDNPEEKTELELTQGDILTILPGCVHSYVAIVGKATAIEVSPNKFETADIYRVES